MTIGYPVPPEIWHKTYAENYAAMLEHHPAAALLLNEEPPDVEVAEGSGKYAVERDGELVIGHDDILYSDMLSKLSVSNACVALGGVKCGSLTADVIGTRMHAAVLINWEHNVYVVESDPEAFMAVMCTPLPGLDIPETHIFLGTGARVRFLERVGSPGVLAPALTFDVTEPITDACHRITEADRAALEANMEEADDRYSGLGERRGLKKCLETGEPINVLFITSLYTTVLQHVCNSMAKAFRALGHNAEVLIEKDPSGVVDALAISEACDRSDFAFMVSRFRPFEGDPVPRGMPFVGWMQDMMPGAWKECHRQERHDLVYTLEVGYRSWMEQVGFRDVGILPFAADTDIYRPKGLGHGQDMAVIMNYSRTNFKNEDSAECMAERMVYVDKLDEMGVELTFYGRGWDQTRYKDRWKGYVTPGPDLRDVYERAGSVLQVGVSSHCRVFEATTAGGIVFAAKHKEDGFEGGFRENMGGRIQQFVDADELFRLHERAVSDSSWREKTINVARNHTLRHHTYEARAARVLRDLEEVL